MLSINLIIMVMMRLYAGGIIDTDRLMFSGSMTILTILMIMVMVMEKSLRVIKIKGKGKMVILGMGQPIVLQIKRM